MTTDMAESHSVRTTSRGRLRRAQILQVATERFLALGYEGVSVDEIIRIVGGSKTNLYRHFGGKEGLFSAVIIEACDGFINSLENLDVAPMAPATGLVTLGRALLEILLEDRHIAFQRLVLAESGRFPEMSRLWFQSGPQRSRSVIAAFLRAKQRQGELGRFDPDAIAVLYHDMVVTNPLYLSLLGMRPSPEEIERATQLAATTLLEGIRQSGAPKDGPVGSGAATIR